MFVREKLNGAVSATYLVGPRGPEYRRDHATGTIRWYCYDGLGSVLGECDSSGNLTATRSYDVYGAVRTSAGTSTSKHKYVGSLGHPSEDESGLIYMRARFMDPITGCFISEDPSRCGDNWHKYCSGNPVERTDPTGRSWLSGGTIDWLVYVFKELLGWNTVKLMFLINFCSKARLINYLAKAMMLMQATAGAEAEVAGMIEAADVIDDVLPGHEAFSATNKMHAGVLGAKAALHAAGAEGLMIIIELLEMDAPGLMI